MPMLKTQTTPLFTEAEWNFETLEKVFKEIQCIAEEDLGLNVYPIDIEIISAEQMLDAYCSIGMPQMYRHWSFGKRFAREEELYRRGFQGLAYEIVINSSPCIAYCMEGNTMTMQTLVMAHAAFGHNHFFKNNCLFKQWTDAEGILEYLRFAKDYIAQCEEKYGIEKVEEILDAAHALMDQGVFRYQRRHKINWKKELEEKEARRKEYAAETYNPLWGTLPRSALPKELSDEERKLRDRKRELQLPEENILYFLEKNSPILKEWQREILRIARNLAQYFYPQKQTKMMNEGCATFVHHHILYALYEKGLLGEGSMIEFVGSHTNVTFQPGFDDPRYSGINPYHLGFEMMQDIKRICTGTDPTTGKPCPSDVLEEDARWFKGQDIIGKDWRDVLKDAWANYRDESFVLQFLSPYLIRKLNLFALADVHDTQHYEVVEVSDDEGYQRIRQLLAQMYDLSFNEPDIQIVDVDLLGDRRLRLQHTVHDHIVLKKEDASMTLEHIKRLWGYDVTLVGVNQEDGTQEYNVSTNNTGSEEYNGY